MFTEYLYAGRARAIDQHKVLGMNFRKGWIEQAQKHLTTAKTMYGEMEICFWLEQAQAELSGLG